MALSDAAQQQQTGLETSQQQLFSHKQQHPFRIRTITVFLELPPAVDRWEPEIAAAGTFLRMAQRHLERIGYEVQTTRIATQPFPEYLHGGSSSGSGSSNQDLNQQQQQKQQQHEGLSQDVYVQNALKLESLAAKHGINLVSIGSSSNVTDLTVIPQIITSTQHVSCSFAMSADASHILAQKVAAVIMQVAAATEGLGNFRFAVSSNIKAGIPYFPVAAAGPKLHRAFAIGTESDALLYEAFSAAAAAAAAAAAGSSVQVDVLAAAEQKLAAVMQERFGHLESAALAIEAAAAVVPHHSTSDQQSLQHQQQRQQQQHFKYLGLDTSIAPGLDTPALTASYDLLGIGGFGGPGSLTVSSVITRVLKHLNLRMTGYCGLMLAVCEDQGLAAAAAAGSITISQLLQYSAVCGCGLDTVPVQGPSLGCCIDNNSSNSSSSSSKNTLQLQQEEQENDDPNTDPAAAAAAAEDGRLATLQGGGELSRQQNNDTQRHTGTVNTKVAAAAAAADAETTALIAALLLDVNTLAYRLNKPLACRLLPLPGKRPGDHTGFDHPYLINSKVMDLRK